MKSKRPFRRRDLHNKELMIPGGGDLARSKDHHHHQADSAQKAINPGLIHYNTHAVAVKMFIFRDII